MDLIIDALDAHPMGYEKDVITDERAHRTPIDSRVEKAVAIFIAQTYRINEVKIDALDHVTITGWLNDDDGLIDSDAHQFKVTFEPPDE